jgi:hypothetical protein
MRGPLALRAGRRVDEVDRDEKARRSQEENDFAMTNTFQRSSVNPEGCPDRLT